ncbi:MAG: zinc ABC transporter substrate-binding protein [Nesterenkonia sp.]|nr:zinc ABC transporter substrate-binding protein [Nesterenkonia sp.]
MPLPPVRRCGLLLATVMLLAACTHQAPESDSSDEGDPPLVLTTFSVLEDMTSEVAGDRIDVRTIAPRGAEIHEYDPKPSDLRTAAEADLILSNGLGLEAWYDRFLDQVEAENVTVSRDVDPIPVTRLPGHPETAEDLPANPHAWMSPSLAQEYVSTIERALTDLSPEDADHFSSRAEDYRGQLRQIHDEARTRLDALDGPAHLVTCEGAFSYLAEDLGLEEHYLWPVNAGTEGTPQQVEAQIEYVRSHDVPTIFCESTVNDAAQRQVAEAAEVEMGDPLHVDSLTEEDGPAPTFLDMLRYDIHRIISGAESVEEADDAEDETEDGDDA